jgi:intracellular septation protein A
MISSSMPPLLWSAYELIKIRRIDAISLTIVVSILLTVGATALGGSARLIQIRDALVTGAIGLAFLASLLVMRRPLIFYLARAAMARGEEGIAAYETIWDQPGVPAVFRWLSVVWGLGLVAQTAAMCFLAWIWPISRYMLLSQPVSYAIFGVLMAVSLAYIARRPAAKAIVSNARAFKGSASPANASKANASSEPAIQRT